MIKTVKYWHVQVFDDACEGAQPIMSGYQPTPKLEVFGDTFLMLTDTTGTITQGIRLDKFSALRIEPIHEE